MIKFYTVVIGLVHAAIVKLATLSTKAFEARNKAYAEKKLQNEKAQQALLNAMCRLQGKLRDLRMAHADSQEAYWKSKGKSQSV